MAHLPIYNYILNNPHLDYVARQLMNNSQLDLWLPWWPTIQRLQNVSPSNYPPFTTFTKALIKFSSLGCTFTPSFDVTIRGGSTAIIDKLPFDASTIKSWRTRSLMFEDQLVTLDGQYAKNWDEINQHPTDLAKKSPGHQPQWYKFYIDTKTISTNKRLLSPLNITKARLPLHKPPKVAKVASDNFFRPRKEWSVYWHAQSSRALYGKTVEQRNDPSCQSISYIEHWIHNPPESFSQFGTPKKYPPILTPCPGCSLHTPYHRDIRPKCIFMAPTLHLHRIKTNHQDYIRSNFPSIPYKKFVILTQPIHHLKVLIYNIYIHSIGIPPQINLPSDPNTNSLSSAPLTNTDSSIITRLLLGCTTSISNLLELSSKCANKSHLIFYTDGSVINLGTPLCASGLGWLETSDPSNILTFKARIIHHASSTRSESMAILTAIITAPRKSSITIHTDSASCIQTLNKILDPLTSLRKLHKIPNYLIWQTIKYIISFNELSLTLIKVKAHSNDINNDLADALAKEGARLDSPLHINFKHIPKHNATLTWLNLGPIERPARKWARDTLACQQFNKYINSSHISPLLSRCKKIPIDFSLTKEWLNYNPFASVTSADLSSYIGYKIKSLNFLLPTCDRLQQNLPHIYPKIPIVCPSCNSSIDSNDYIIICSKYSDHIRDLLLSHERSLALFLYEKQPTPDLISLSNIQQWITSSPLFNTSNATTISNNLDLILLSHQFIPKSLDDLFLKIFPKKNLRHHHLIDFLHFFLMDLRKITWLAHCDARADWEKSLNITQRTKRSKKPAPNRRHHSRLPTSSNRAHNSPPHNPNFSSSLWLIWPRRIFYILDLGLITDRLYCNMILI
ncbi:hypothetical protein C1645_831357 [Glomus cerebriforme]|uniref:RNase H type-1 domain-containing protein n=1 Tax=Glomus cerebriforme TaxID=658196 RepID=A0A397SK95_9GLOM|nr:hypothetical protein C1645_831357 [Glomus cerebriforme]